MVANLAKSPYIYYNEVKFGYLKTKGENYAAFKRYFICA